jgi:hypothetical protein
MSHKPCLILNQDYRPLQAISWKRAICLEIIGKEIPGEGIRIIEYYEDDFVLSAGGEKFFIPAVAVTGRYIKVKRILALKKRNLMIRDQRECQYCGRQTSLNVATIDHVKPQSHFQNKKEAHTWDNTVIACLKCNTSKKNNTPEQAGMKLRREPTFPKNIELYRGVNPWDQIPKEWQAYVPV